MKGLGRVNKALFLPSGTCAELYCLLFWYYNKDKNYLFIKINIFLLTVT